MVFFCGFQQTTACSSSGLQANFCVVVSLGSLGVAPLAHGLHPLHQSSSLIPSPAPCTVCLEKWGVTVSLCLCLNLPHSTGAQSSLWGDGAVEGRGWRQWERDVVVWQDGGMASLSTVGILDPKALGQGHGYSLRIAQVA